MYCPSSEAALAVREMRAFGLSLHDRLVTNRPGFNAKMSELHAVVGRFNLTFVSRRLNGGERWRTTWRSGSGGRLPGWSPNCFARSRRRPGRSRCS
ncbi:MAG: hypothetical protein KY475_20665 [Planctomycetes bacterium]|nr:hypothetical protein [Planctomycetota bacterium]